MKLATWNVYSLSVRLPQVLDWPRPRSRHQARQWMCWPARVEDDGRQFPHRRH
ncbi:MAG: hypothetical protein IPH37_13425 [Burkholderiales bacterium]|nr:hypothetical protein [Burkholderiales bacterium]